MDLLQCAIYCLLSGANFYDLRVRSVYFIIDSYYLIIRKEE